MKKLPLIMFFFFIFGCDKKYTISSEDIGSIYRKGYYDGISAARKCIKEKTVITDKFIVNSFDYADTLFIIDSLKFLQKLN